MKYTKSIAMSLTLITWLISAPTAYADALPVPEQLQISQGVTSEQADTLLETAQKYYAFWNTGEERYANEALSPDFTDLNLPEGRPQGPKGPLMASAGFRQAVPDLSMTVRSTYILANKVISQLEFNGHFTGTFGDVKGDGQAISFSAVDMYTIENGKIMDNWHLEDNLTLMQQLGIVNQ